MTSQPRAGVSQREEWEKSSLKRLEAFKKWWEVAEPREQGKRYRAEEVCQSQSYISERWSGELA